MDVPKEDLRRHLLRDLPGMHPRMCSSIYLRNSCRMYLRIWLRNLPTSLGVYFRIYLGTSQLTYARICQGVDLGIYLGMSLGVYRGIYLGIYLVVYLGN